MALTGNRILCNTPTGAPYRHLPVRRPFLIPCWSTPPRSHGRSHIIVSAAKKGRFESKNRTGSLSTKEKVKEDEKQASQPSIGAENDGPESPIATAADGFVMPVLPGKETDFWEGPQWDAFGFFLQYLWAFGIVFAALKMKKTVLRQTRQHVMIKFKSFCNHAVQRTYGGCSLVVEREQKYNDLSAHSRKLGFDLDIRSDLYKFL